MKKPLYLSLILTISLLGLIACSGGERQRAAQESGSEPAAQAAEISEAAAPSGDAQAGQEQFEKTCAACHGPAGEGVQGLGKDMTASEFIAGKSDEELVAFIKVGRDPSDPLNTTGVGMPSKGGNPALSDEDLTNIVSYIRTLQQ